MSLSAGTAGLETILIGAQQRYFMCSSFSWTRPSALIKRGGHGHDYPDQEIFLTSGRVQQTHFFVCFPFLN
jgi:hypothetical protein